MYFIDRLEFRKVVQDRLIQWRDLRVSRLVDGLDHPVFSRRIESRVEPTRWGPLPNRKRGQGVPFPRCSSLPEELNPLT
jgi:hypothetical protein